MDRRKLEMERASQLSMTPISLHKTSKYGFRHKRKASSIALYDPGIKAFDIEIKMAQALLGVDPNTRPDCFRNIFEEYIFIFTVMMATACTTFLQGVIIINTSTIGRDLRMSPAQITWIAAAIGLTSGSFVLLFGKTADIFGSRTQLISGMAALSIFSLITAFSANAISMNVLCGFLGLGTAVISPPAIGTLFAIYPEGQRRNRVTGALGTGNPLGFVLGSISTGLATKYSTWRTSFFVVAIFFAIMTALATWTMPRAPRSGSISRVLKNFDYFGTTLTVAGLALVSAGLTEGPELGWKSYKVILMLVVGGFCLFGFGFWENINKNPLLNPIVWRSRNFTLCVLCVGFGYMSFITNQFWIALYMQDIQKLTPLHIATRLLPQAIVGVAWSYIGQALVSRVSGKVIMGIGAVAYLVGATLVSFIREKTSYWSILFPALCITVIGADFQFIISNLYISKHMPTQLSLAAGVLQSIMRLSVSVGLSITAATYGSVIGASGNDFSLAYQRAYLCSILFALVGLLFVPFMHIGMQGGKHSPRPSLAGSTIYEEAPPRTGGEYMDNMGSDTDRIVGPKASQTSLGTGATVSSLDSVFPRWSWEGDAQWPDDKKNYGSNVVYEVCIKCLQERRVMVQPREPSIAGELESFEDSEGHIHPVGHPHGWHGDKSIESLYAEVDSHAHMILNSHGQQHENEVWPGHQSRMPIGHLNHTAGTNDFAPRIINGRERHIPEQTDVREIKLGETGWV